jgi:hypothetical protein
MALESFERNINITNLVLENMEERRSSTFDPDTEISGEFGRELQDFVDSSIANTNWELDMVREYVAILGGQISEQSKQIVENKLKARLRDDLDERDQEDPEKVFRLLSDAVNYKLIFLDTYDPELLQVLDEQTVIQAARSTLSGKLSTFIGMFKVLHPDASRELTKLSSLINLRTIIDAYARTDLVNSIRVVAELRLITGKLEELPKPFVSWPKLMDLWRKTKTDNSYPDLISLASWLKICAAKEVVIDDKGAHITMPEKEAAKLELPEIRNF